MSSVYSECPTYYIEGLVTAVLFNYFEGHKVFAVLNVLLVSININSKEIQVLITSSIPCFYEVLRIKNR